jgi:hypothetical protein
LPAGMFLAGITSATFKVLVSAYDSTASIKYKLTNGTDDTGYILDGATGTFPAFVSAPTQLIIQLNPNVTINYPGIFGVAGYTK